MTAPANIVTIPLQQKEVQSVIATKPLSLLWNLKTSPWQAIPIRIAGPLKSVQFA